MARLSCVVGVVLVRSTQSSIAVLVSFPESIVDMNQKAIPIKMKFTSVLCSFQYVSVIEVS